MKTGIWIDALIRRAQVAGAFACVVGTAGDRDAGTVLVCVRARDMHTLYVPERDFAGVRVWRAHALPEDEMLERIARRRAFDTDLVVVDVEDAKGRHFIEEAVLDDPTAKEEAPDAAQEAREAAAAAARAAFRDR